MPLVTLKELLNKAKDNKYAVGAFNMLSIENVRGAIMAAEELKSPIILQLAEVHLKHAPIEFLAPVMLEAAKKAKVPVAVHFDHGTNLLDIKKAISLGFSSVMYDGAGKPIEENIRLTKEVVEYASASGVSVEAELGQVGGSEDGNDDIEACLTDVEEAIRFVKETNIDALAIAIGNLHGQYKALPNLHFQRLSELNEAVNIPLVLHGGSGTGVDGFKRCIANGIAKINVATAVHSSIAEAYQQLANNNNPTYFYYIGANVQATYEAVKKHMEIFESIGKVI